MPATEPECRVSVRAVPNASKDAVAGYMDDGVLKIKIQAPPDGGRANKALVVFLAKSLNLSKSEVELESGASSRNKRVLIRGIDEEVFRQRLGLA